MAAGGRAFGIFAVNPKLFRYFTLERPVTERLSITPTPAYSKVCSTPEEIFPRAADSRGIRSGIAPQAATVEPNAKLANFRVGSFRSILPVI